MSKGYSASESRTSTSAAGRGKLGDGSPGRGLADKDGYLNLRAKDAEFFAQQEPKVSLSLNKRLIEGSTYTKFKLPNGKDLMFTRIAEWDRNGNVTISSVPEDVIREELENAGYKNIGDDNEFNRKMYNVIENSTKEIESKFKSWFEKEVEKPETRNAVRAAKQYTPKTAFSEGVGLDIEGTVIPIVRKGDVAAIDYNVAKSKLIGSNALSDKGISEVINALKKQGFKQA